MSKDPIFLFVQMGHVIDTVNSFYNQPLLFEQKYLYITSKSSVIVYYYPAIQFFIIVVNLNSGVLRLFYFFVCT